MIQEHNKKKEDYTSFTIGEKRIAHQQRNNRGYEGIRDIQQTRSTLSASI